MVIHAWAGTAWPSDVSAQLCTLLVGDVRGQGVYDVKQQLLAQ